jgi:hypothetical protein
LRSTSTVYGRHARTMLLCDGVTEACAALHRPGCTRHLTPSYMGVALLPTAFPMIKAVNGIFSSEPIQRPYVPYVPNKPSPCGERVSSWCKRESVCVRECVCERERVCVCVRERVCVCVCACVFECATRLLPACRTCSTNVSSRLEREESGGAG